MQLRNKTPSKPLQRKRSLGNIEVTIDDTPVKKQRIEVAVTPRRKTLRSTPTKKSSPALQKSKDKQAKPPAKSSSRKKKVEMEEKENGNGNIVSENVVSSSSESDMEDETKYKNYKVSRIAKTSGFNLQIDEDENSDDEEGVDIEEALKKVGLEQQRKRQTGKWRKEEDDGDGDEWDDFVRMHSSATPLKETSGKENKKPPESPAPLKTPVSKRLRRSNVPAISSPLKQSFNLTESPVLPKDEDETNKTPRSVSLRRSGRLNPDDSTPLRNLGFESPSKKITDTPGTRRTRRKYTIAQTIENAADNAIDFDHETVSKYAVVNSSEDELSEVEESEENGLETSIFNINYKNYFQELQDAKGRGTTSDNTLDQLPIIEYDEYLKLLNSCQMQNQKRKNDLFRLLQRDFGQWKFELECGYSLLLYGWGSKKELINRFIQERLSDSDVVLINGFFSSINLRSILAKILVDFMHKSNTPGTLTDLANEISSFYNISRNKLYVVINNIDGPGMRNEKTQEALEKLGRSKGIHLIASVDHFNAVFTWDSARSRAINFIYHDVTTFQSYSDEISMTDDSLNVWTSRLLMRHGQQTDGVSIRGAIYVLTSLTSMAKEVFKLLVKHQLEVEECEGKTQKLTWDHLAISSQALFQKCQQNFLTNSHENFKTQLREFIDHKLVISACADDGTDILYIPFRGKHLEELFEELDSE